MFNVLKGALEIAAKKDIRHSLNGVQVTRKNDVIKVNATDGRALYQAVSTKAEWLDIIDEGVDMIIDHEALASALKMFKKNNDVPLKVSDLSVSINGLNISTVDGRYPDVKRIIKSRKNTPNGSETGISLGLFAKVCKAGRLALAGEKYDGMRMSCGDSNSSVMFEAFTADFSLLIIQVSTKVNHESY